MNQKPLRTLILWMIWASTTLVIYLALYRNPDIWKFVVDDSTRITWLILGMFMLGLIGSFMLTIIVTLESIRGNHIQHVIQEGGLQGLTISSRQRAVDRFFDGLQIAIRTAGQPDVEALLHAELSAYQRGSHSVEVLGNMLITFGLIGTVVGLTMTLSGLTSSLDALGHDQETLMNGLRQAMGGMGTAFYTTLLGAVLGGVLLRIFAQITDNGVESLFDATMRTCLVYCSGEYTNTIDREVKFLNAEVRVLGKNLKNIEAAFQEAKVSINEFRDEVGRLSKGTDETGNDSLEAAIARHRRYCEVLREEMELINAVNNSWWARLRSLFGFRR